MKSPKVSIIIPCYNAARYLAETLDSVLAQTFDNYELIIINDGSTDGTADIVEAYRQRFKDRLTYEAGPNQGVSTARNRGTTLAAGEYFQYLDADDLLCDHSLEHKVTVLDNSGADVAYGDWRMLMENQSGDFVKGKIFAEQIDDRDSSPSIAILTGFWVPPAALLYRRKIVECIGGWNERVQITGDGRFMFDAASAGGTFIHVPGVHADYRVVADQSNFSKRDPGAFLRCWIRNVEEIEHLWREYGTGINASRQEALLKAYGRYMSPLFEHDRSSFWSVYRKIRSIDPDYLPVPTGKMRLTSRLLGYPGAEALALLGRRLQRCLSATGFFLSATHHDVPLEQPKLDRMDRQE